MNAESQHSKMPRSKTNGQVAYCTMFDSGYLARGLALIHSLRSEGVDDDIWVLCLDDTVTGFLTDLDLRGVHILTILELEQSTPDLAAARDNRSRVEFFFTCTPSLVCAVMDRSSHCEWVIYLDSDMYFFAPPTRVFSEIGEGDVGIVPHRFPDQLKSLEQYGTFNVAWVMFRTNAQGRSCAEWWRDRCLEWCYDRPDSGRYADQGYLDEFSMRFPTTVVISDPGVNVAPWNLGRHSVTAADGSVFIDGQQLVFFHFHGLRQKGEWIYPNIATYKATLTTEVRDQIYLPYIAALNGIERGTASVNFGRPLPAPQPQAVSRNQRNFRSAAYRARRRFLQFRERRAGGAFRIGDVDDEGVTTRRYN
jgi:hypothetical protein